MALQMLSDNPPLQRYRREGDTLSPSDFNAAIIGRLDALDERMSEISDRLSQMEGRNKEAEARSGNLMKLMGIFVSLLAGMVTVGVFLGQVILPHLHWK